MKLEDLKTDIRVRGIDPAGDVKILHVEQLGPDAVTVTYQRASGPVGQDTIFRADEPRLAAVKASLELSFGADPHDFKLAVEALRIELAHLFDPMMAVHTADVEPLPHQISAVYEEMLTRQEAMGRTVKDVAEKFGYDIESYPPGGGDWRLIEVKRRIKDAKTVTVTANEVHTALNKGDKFLLAIVLVDGDEVEGRYYIRQPFTKEPEPFATSIQYDIDKLLAMSREQVTH